MTVAAEQAVCAGQTGDRAARHGRQPRPPAQGAVTIEQRSPAGAGAYALILRQQSPSQRMVADDGAAGCASIIA